MQTRKSPFLGEDEDRIYDAILADEPLYPVVMPRSCVGLVQGLLIREPEIRLGYSRGAKEVMEEPFFKSIDWKALYEKRVTPAFIPKIETWAEGSYVDVGSFDPEFTSVTPKLTPAQTGKCFHTLKSLGWQRC